MFICQHTRRIVIIAVYVDNILIALCCHVKDAKKSETPANVSAKLS